LARHVTILRISVGSRITQPAEGGHDNQYLSANARRAYDGDNRHSAAAGRAGPGALALRPADLLVLGQAHRAAILTGVAPIPTQGGAAAQGGALLPGSPCSGGIQPVAAQKMLALRGYMQGHLGDEIQASRRLLHKRLPAEDRKSAPACPESIPAGVSVPRKPARGG
jgi:hypothetical protein